MSISIHAPICNLKYEYKAEPFGSAFYYFFFAATAAPAFGRFAP
jgi:hypothetical protein